MITRREMLTGAAAAVPALALTKLYSQDGIGVIPNCVWTKRAPGSEPSPNVIPCGDSCANEGMAGHYPNCYYPQYLNLNQNLAYATSAVRNQTTHAVIGRTITQVQWNTLLAYGSAITAHLSLAQTTISDKLRIQTIANMLYEWPSSKQVSIVQQWAAQNGYDPNEVGSLVSTSPPLNAYSDPTLHAMIMALTNSGGMDNLSSWVDSQANGVTVLSTGICAYINPPQLVKVGTALVVIGSGITAFGENLGQAAGAVTSVGDLTAAFGFDLAKVGEMCVY